MSDNLEPLTDAEIADLERRLHGEINDTPFRCLRVETLDRLLAMARELNRRDQVRAAEVRPQRPMFHDPLAHE